MLIMLAAAALCISSDMSPYMLSSTWWLYLGEMRFPCLSKTPRFFESGITVANRARSASVARGAKDTWGMYFAALSMISGSCHNF